MSLSTSLKASVSSFTCLDRTIWPDDCSKAKLLYRDKKTKDSKNVRVVYDAETKQLGIVDWTGGTTSYLVFSLDDVVGSCLELNLQSSAGGSGGEEKSSATLWIYR